MPNSFDDYMRWAAMLSRIIIIWYAFALLLCCSRGGKEQIQALERVRLDMADGTLGDGWRLQETNPQPRASMRRC